MNGLRAGKYAFRAASIVVELLILLIVAGPVAGAVSPDLGSHYGLGIELSSIQPQVQQALSSGSIEGTHEISVPAFNNWPLSGKAGLTIAFVVGNQTIYQSQPATVELAPFQSGEIDVSLVFSPSFVSEIQGQNLGLGGTMTVSEGQFWTITVNLAGS